MLDGAFIHAYELGMVARHDTRTTLLCAARELFARSGYDGTSIRDITRKAGANLGAVTYHFGTKEKLYEEVLTRISVPFAARLEAESRRAAAPLARIELVVRALFEHLAGSRDLPPLMLHELSLDRPAPGPIRDLIAGIFGLLSDLVRAGQRDKSIVAGDPTLLTVSIVAQPVYMTLVRNPLRDVVGLDTRDAAMRARIADHVVASVRRTLTAHRRQR